MELKEFYNGLSEDVKAKVKACGTEEEMMQVLSEEGVELDPEVLEAVSGGGHNGYLHSQNNRFMKSEGSWC